MNVRETFARHKRPILIGVVCLILLVLAWFMFRTIQGLKQQASAERELLLRQRAEREREIAIRDSLQMAKEDSLIMELLGIRTKVEYRIIEREKYITRFIDTASIATKFRYVDSLLGK